MFLNQELLTILAGESKLSTQQQKYLNQLVQKLIAHYSSATRVDLKMNAPSPWFCSKTFVDPVLTINLKNINSLVIWGGFNNSNKKEKKRILYHVTDSFVRMKAVRFHSVCSHPCALNCASRLDKPAIDKVCPLSQGH